MEKFTTLRRCYETHGLVPRRNKSGESNLFVLDIHRYCLTNGCYEYKTKSIDLARLTLLTLKPYEILCKIISYLYFFHLLHLQVEDGGKTCLGVYSASYIS